MTHTGEKQFECEICKKKFIKRDNMKRHKNIHFKIERYILDGDIRERPHVCNICNKKYLKKSYLTEHEKSHTGTFFKNDIFS